MLDYKKNQSEDEYPIDNQAWWSQGGWEGLQPPPLFCKLVMIFWSNKIK